MKRLGFTLLALMTMAALSGCASSGPPAGVKPADCREAPEPCQPSVGRGGFSAG